MRSLRNILLIVLLFLVSGLFSCKKENLLDCVKSTGKIVRENRDISSFSSIRLDDRINLYITYSSQLSLSVEGGKNLQEFIITEVKNGQLSIQNDNRCNWVRSYNKDINVYLSTPILSNIEYYGSGEVRFTNLFKGDRFILNMWEASGNVDLFLDCREVELKSHTGPADIYCSGTTQKLVAYTNGLGRMNLVDFIAKEVLAVNTNSADLKIRADSLLNANIDGRGDILYKGDPVISLRDDGAGSLIKLD